MKPIFQTLTETAHRIRQETQAEITAALELNLNPQAEYARTVADLWADLASRCQLYHSQRHNSSPNQN